MPLWGKILIVILAGGFVSIFFLIGFYLLRKSYKDLVNVYSGLISGETGLLSFLFMLFGILFTLMFGFVFTVVPLFFLLMILSLVVLNLDPESMMNTMFQSGFLNSTNLLLALVFLLVILPVLIAILIVKKYDKGFKVSYVKSNKTYIKKNISFSSSNRSSRSSSSSSRSSFSGDGGRSGGGGASGRW